MLMIPSPIIDSCYSFTGKGWYPFHMLAMEISPNRFDVVVTVAKIDGPKIHFPFTNPRREESTKRTLWDRVKQLAVKWFGKTKVEQRPVDPVTPEFNVRFIELHSLLEDLGNSRATAAEIASYADVSSQLWMGSPFVDDHKFAAMYVNFHSDLMAAAAKGVNWVVVESDYIDQAYFNRNNLRKHVESVVRSRYAYFCKSVCFDLTHAISYLPANIQDHARLVLAYEPVSTAAQANLLAYCNRVTENGPKGRTLFTPGVADTFFKMLETHVAAINSRS